MTTPPSSTKGNTAFPSRMRLPYHTDRSSLCFRFHNEAGCLDAWGFQKFPDSFSLLPNKIRAGVAGIKIQHRILWYIKMLLCRSLMNSRRSPFRSAINCTHQPLPVQNRIPCVFSFIRKASPTWEAANTSLQAPADGYRSGQWTYRIFSPAPSFPVPRDFADASGLYASSWILGTAAAIHNFVLEHSGT